MPIKYIVLNGKSKARRSLKFSNPLEAIKAIIRMHKSNKWSAPMTAEEADKEDLRIIADNSNESKSCQ